MAQKKKSSKTQTNKTSKNKRFLHKNIKNKTLLINFGIMFIGFIIVFLTLNSASFFGIYNYEPGSILKEDLYLQNDVVDIAATERLKNERALEIEPIMMVDFSVQAESKRNLTEFFSRLSEVKFEYANDTDLLKRVYAGIERKNLYNLDETELKALATISNEKIEIIKNYALDLTTERLTAGVTSEDREAILNNIDSYVSAQNDIDDFDKGILSKIISGALVVNKFIDVSKTDDKINAEL